MSSFYQSSLRQSVTLKWAVAIFATILIQPTVTAAENAVLLEGFEQNLDSVTALGSRATLSTYTATDAADPLVTQGTKSLEVEVKEVEFWAQDFRITFPDQMSE